MKTLDVVIEELHFWDTCDEWPESFYDFEVTRDALHYLKILQDVTCGTSQKLRNTSQITCPKCHSEFVILPDANNPLTWDELKQMEGKPVWVEALLYKQWAIVACVYADYIRFEGANLYAPEHRIYMGEDNGWQAYRKERNEDA